MEEDEFGNVSFVGMQRVPVIFDDQLLFLSYLVGLVMSLNAIQMKMPS